MSPRSRHAVAVTVALTYILAWGLALVVGLAAMIAVPDGEDGGWAALGFLALGFLVGVVIGHIAWTVLTVRLLRGYHRPLRTAATVCLTPVAIVLLMIGINDLGIPWVAWPVVAVAIPAVLAWWTAGPPAGLTTGA